MKFIIFLVLNCATIIAIHKLPHFYHTTDQLNSEVNKILENCPFMNKIQLSADPNIYSLIFNKQPNQQTLKAFIIFGEHSRELISSETGLFLIKSLCQPEKKIFQDILNQYTIQIILNMNPNSRQYVEKGFFCLRENHNGVDLNRNYDIHWEHIEDHVYQVSSGPHPFSEVETLNVKRILEEFQPDVFLSIHSGILALLYPYAYKTEKCKRNYNNIHDIAQQIYQEYCRQCLVGSAAEKIGYTASGSSQDYAYDISMVKYSYTFEIYTREVIPSGQKRSDSQQLNQHSLLLNNHNHHNHNHHQHRHKEKKQKRNIFIQQMKIFDEPISNFAKFLQEKDKTKQQKKKGIFILIVKFHNMNKPAQCILILLLRLDINMKFSIGHQQLLELFNQFMKKNLINEKIHLRNKKIIKKLNRIKKRVNIVNILSLYDKFSNCAWSAN